MAIHPTTRSCLLPAAIILTAGAARPVLAQTVTFQELYTFNGDNAGDQFGRSVSGAGDVNGDGFDDLIVGAWQDDNNGYNSGTARVFSGADGSVLFTFNGVSPGVHFGHSVSGAGDVNGDGFDDVIIGSYYDHYNGFASGSARVFSGANGSALFTFNGDKVFDRFGWSVSGAGDVNGDGFADLIVGAPYASNDDDYSGTARIFSGANGSVLYTFTENSAGERLGCSVSCAGDVNGDGFDDVVVGARRDDNNSTDSGSARVFSGADGSELYTFNGDSANDYLGCSVSGAGDVNGDGFDDLIVGAYHDDRNAAQSGSAVVFSGADGSALHSFSGDGANDFLGCSVSGLGDVNGDGFDDLVVGAYGDDNNGTNSGSARVFSGLDGTVLATFDGDGAIDLFGGSVAGASDVNGDGLDDLIIGARLDDNNGSNSGSVRVFVSYIPRVCADQNEDGQVLPSDFSAWIANFNAQNPIGDVNQDAIVNAADFSAWIAAFNQGENGPTCVP